ncbi:MAG: 16S rRNA (uracil(1498)-N(3))-methyltransferase [Pseudomonadota bacterium]
MIDLTMPRFHFPVPLTPGKHELTSALAHHAQHVLRLRVGDALILFDGAGQEADAQVVAYSDRSMQVEISHVSVLSRETPLKVSLLQALPSGDKMDWIVEKCTELGVHAIQPIQAARSVVRLDSARAAKKQVRWQQIASAACAQCGRNLIPELSPVLSLNEALLSRPHNELRLLLDLAPKATRLSQLDWPQNLTELSILVGPEGAFTDSEISAACAAGFIPINLGARILRTETAGLACLAALNVLHGDF